VNSVNRVIMASNERDTGDRSGMRPNSGFLKGNEALDDGREVQKPHLSPQAWMAVQWRKSMWRQRRGGRWVDEG
jgi:hypothetical protein